MALTGKNTNIQLFESVSMETLSGQPDIEIVQCEGIDYYLNASLWPVVVIDNNWQLRRANHNFLTLVQKSSQQVLGHKLTDFITPLTLEDLDRLFQDVLHSKKRQSLEFQIQNPKRKMIWMEAIARAIIPHAEEMGTFIIVSFRDISERKMRESQLAEKTALLMDTFESIPHPFFVVDIKNFSVEFGNTASGFNNQQQGKISCYQMPFPCESDEHTCIIREVLKTNKPAVREQTFAKPGQDAFYVEVHAYPIFDFSGNVAKVIEYRLDITDRKIAEKNLEDSKAFYETVLTHTSDMIFYVNSHGQVTYFNRAVSLHYNLEPEAINDLIPLKFFWCGEKGIELVEQSYQEVAQTRKTKFIEVSCNEYLYELSINPVTVSDNTKECAMIAVARDITDRKKQEDIHKYHASYDLLTGLPNRRLFQEIFLKEIARARRSKTKIALLFLDLDGFKQINDTQGHDIGDLYLKNLCEQLQKQFREIDTISRFAGDEFCFLFSEIQNDSDIKRMADQILEIIPMKQYPQWQGIQVTGSIGISIYPTDGTDPQDLIRKSDQAMYHAKNNGKNQYFFHKANT